MIKLLMHAYMCRNKNYGMNRNKEGLKIEVSFIKLPSPKWHKVNWCNIMLFSDRIWYNVDILNYLFKEQLAYIDIVFLIHLFPYKLEQNYF